MEQNKKKKSRDAARQRRGQQNDEFSELAAQLPLNVSSAEKLDRLCAMRLSNSFIKIKHVLQQIRETNVPLEKSLDDQLFNSHILKALGGFVFVLSEDGQVLYMSSNVSENLGLQQLDVTGNSIYKYVHPCDQENLAKQLGGQVPLEDMEIFDGLFCSDSSHYVKNPKQAVCAELENSQHRSFSLRMKSTLTSRGKSVNINASIYRVVHCVGTIQTYRTKLGTSNGAMTRCLLAVGTPLLSASSFEVPIDRQTFITKHSLDFKITSVEDLAADIMGYKCRSLVNTSWYLYTHICDTKVIKDCHNAVLKKGQSLSGYYRVLVKDGGWIWMQTKANVVYQSTTGQPQYIVCVHYVISDMELGDVVLSSEQLSANKLAQKQDKMRIHIKTPNETNGEHNPPAKYSKIVPSKPPLINKPSVVPLNTEIMYNDVEVKPQPLPEPIVAEQQKACNSGSESDDLDMPGLEFLDVEEELQDLTTFTERSPFIPAPFSDYDLKNRSLGSLLSELDENELINRAPFIPPPCIDKIISFDDIPLIEFDDGIDIEEGLPASSSTNSLLESTNIDSNQLCDLGNAKVPAHLLKRFFPMMDGKSDNLSA